MYLLERLFILCFGLEFGFELLCLHVGDLVDLSEG